MIHCDTIDQFRLCQWVLSFFDEDSITIELVSDCEIRVYTSDGFLDVFFMNGFSIEYECHFYENEAEIIE